ncbi:transcriptional regulator [Raoultella planticola]|uniref:transcriptional regulator n=1 Tax=Raoultella planticola TaxID=575 RepID=UPI000906F6AF|nr:YdaS family helix-turn-helix protein [Raoultella planticola]
MSGLEKAIQQAGSQAKLASKLGISRSSVNRWLHRFDSKVPPDRLIQIFKLTGVTPHELRPDLHPTPSSGIPAEAIKTQFKGVEQ